VVVVVRHAVAARDRVDAMSDDCAHEIAVLCLS